MPRRACGALIFGIAICSMAVAARAADRDDPGWLLPMPEVDADPKVPTLKQQVGHGWGEDISSHAEIERYLRALAAAAPERSRLVKYGETIEKRGLYLAGDHGPEEPLAAGRDPRGQPSPRRPAPDHARASQGDCASRPLRSSGWPMEFTAMRSRRATPHC